MLIQMCEQWDRLFCWLSGADEKVYLVKSDVDFYAELCDALDILFGGRFCVYVLIGDDFYANNMGKKNRNIDVLKLKDQFKKKSNDMHEEYIKKYGYLLGCHLGGMFDDEIEIVLLSPDPFNQSDHLNFSLSCRLIKYAFMRILATQRLHRSLKSLACEREGLIKVQQQAFHQEKMASIGSLAAGVAHEINNPLAFINANISVLDEYISDLFRLIDFYEENISLLEKEAIDIEAIEQLKEQIQCEHIKKDVPNLMRESMDGMNRVKTIINDLKDFSHSNRIFELANIKDVVEKACNLAYSEIKHKASLEKVYSYTGLVECAPLQLGQVIINILVNAAHAIEEYGNIKIGVRKDEKKAMLIIEIQDNGCGMEDEVIKKIFDPFFTTKPIGKGTGLGLSLCYRIIESHNGTLEVQSEVGVGSCFKLILPIRHMENKRQ